MIILEIIMLQRAVLLVITDAACNCLTITISYYGIYWPISASVSNSSIAFFAVFLLPRAPCATRPSYSS